MSYGSENSKVSSVGSVGRVLNARRSSLGDVNKSLLDPVKSIESTQDPSKAMIQSFLSMLLNVLQ